MDNNPDAPAVSLDRYRSYLLLLAQMQLHDRPRAKIDPSDIVQQTMLEVYAKQEQFHGDHAGLMAWLRQALVHNLRDALRALKRDKRDVGRECSLEAVDQASHCMASWLAANQSSPSQQAARNEDLLRLADALAGLPEPQRRAVVLHHLQGCTLSEVARQLARSDAAVAGLLYRGLKRLRALMGTPNERLKEAQTQP